MFFLDQLSWASFYLMMSPGQVGPSVCGYCRCPTRWRPESSKRGFRTEDSDTVLEDSGYLHRTVDNKSKEKPLTVGAVIVHGQDIVR